jgi:peptidyl-prolyl cis-trans isomerase C
MPVLLNTGVPPVGAKEAEESMTKRRTPTQAIPHRTILLLTVSVVLVGSSAASAQASGLPSIPASAVVARVNGASINETEVLNEMEVLYPSNTAHGGIRHEKLKEIRSKALEELIVQELAYQQAVKTQALVPMTEVRAEWARLRQKYGAADFDRSLQASGLTRQQYLKNLQRRMTLERLIKQRIFQPSRVGPAALRAYYNKNTIKFKRPEQIHARLILAAIDAQKSDPEQERKAKEKIDKVYQELKAGKDFAALAGQYSDDFYKVKGGDLGWVHRGRLEPDFEKVAFNLPVGKFSEPFRTPYGYNLMKVEGREPVRQMKFEEVRTTLQAELEQKKYQELRQAWVEGLKKGAQIEILENPASGGVPETRAAH